MNSNLQQSIYLSPLLVPFEQDKHQDRWNFTILISANIRELVKSSY